MKFPADSLDTTDHFGYNTRMKTKPRMSRAHYNFLAQFINDYAQDLYLSPSEHVILATRAATVLIGTNPNFDAEKFYCAATKDLARDPQETA